MRDAKPLGIFTRQDVIGRVVLPQRPLTTPIREVMSAPVVTLPADATAGDAALVDGAAAASATSSSRDERRQGRRRRVRARPVQPAAAVGARARLGDPPRAPTSRRSSSAQPTFARCRIRWSRRVSPPGS